MRAAAVLAVDVAVDADSQAGSVVRAAAAAAAVVLAVACSVFGSCVAFPRAIFSSVAAWTRRTEDVGGAGKTIVVPGKKIELCHSPTGIELSFTKEQMRAADASPSMQEYAAAVAAEHAPGQASSDLVRPVPSTPEKAAAATAIACLLDHPSTRDHDIAWTKSGPDGNKLNVHSSTGDVCATRYGTYKFIDAERHNSKNTLMITPKFMAAIVEARDEFAKESLNGEAINVLNLPADRPVVGFVVGMAFLLEEMQREAGGVPFIGGHVVNSADKQSTFAWHVD